MEKFGAWQKTVSNLNKLVELRRMASDLYLSGGFTDQEFALFVRCWRMAGFRLGNLITEMRKENWDC